MVVSALPAVLGLRLHTTPFCAIDVHESDLVSLAAFAVHAVKQGLHAAHAAAGLRML